MKISFNWLNKIVKTDKSAKEIASLLTLSGAEVETIKKQGNDYLLDLDITPNRGDEFSVLGIAREVSALTGEKIILPNPKIEEDSDGKPLTIEILDEMACPRFTCRIISDIQIKPSPKWIIKRLKSYGFRSINNIVDITNLVMVELGQPLHAFDYNKISGFKMIIRRAKDGERVKTLDGVERILTNNAIIIEDDKNLIDLAGIMGGELSEVDSKTNTIILEAAIFNPVLIRKASKEQSLVTDASYRFEREIDPKGQILALNRACELILKYAGGKSGPLIDITKIKFKAKKIIVDLKKVSSLIGFKINQIEAIKYLIGLGFKINNKNIQSPEVQVPSWRNDINIWQDVAEEIARIKGYEKIKPIALSKQKPKYLNNKFKQKEILKDRLTDLEFSEIYSYNFLSSSDLEILKKTNESLYEIENPVAPENRYLRDSLFPSLIKAIAKNPTFSQIKIFEIGEVFDLKNGERTYLGIAMSGDKIGKITKVIENINQMTLSDLKWKTKILNKDELKRYKIKKGMAAIAEADLTQFLNDKPFKGEYSQIKKLNYREISKFPSVSRDFAFIVENKLNASSIANKILGLSPLIVRVELFDEYESKNFGQNNKSLAFHIQFQSADKTLTKDEAESLSNKIIKLIETKYKGKLRDK